MMKAIVNKVIPVRFLTRIRSLVLAVLPAFLCAGCQDVVSTSPFVGEGQAMLDDRLIGTWVEPSDPDAPRELDATDDPADQVIVERGTGDRYQLTSFEDGEAQEFSAQLTQIGSHRFLQVAHECSSHLFFKPDSGEQCYYFVKVEIEDDSLSFALLDYERVFQDSLSKKLNVEHEIRRQVGKDGIDSTCIILTAPTEDLRRFLEAYTADGSVFEDSTTSVRKRDD